MGLVLQVLVTGLAAGAVYGLVAVGFSLVYRLPAVLQFAHGDLIGASAFLSILLAVGTDPVAVTSAGVARYTLAALTALVVSGLAGALLYVFAIRPATERAGAFGWIGATTALAFVIEGTLAAVFPREAYVLPDPLRFSSMAPVRLPHGATLPPRAFFVLGVGFVVALAARLVLTRSSFGIAVSAIASEPVAARAVGLPVERLIATAFGIAGGLAAIAGIVGMPSGGSITVETGAMLGLKGIAAALLGGLVNADRVFASALTIGVLEEAITNLHVGRVQFGPAWRNIVPLLLVLIVLAARAPRHAQEAAE